MALNIANTVKRYAVYGKALNDARDLITNAQHLADVVNGIRLAAQTDFIEYVHADSKLPEKTLHFAREELMRQWKLDVGAPTVNAPTTSGLQTITYFSGSGLGLGYTGRPYDRLDTPIYFYRPHTYIWQCVEAPRAGANWTARFQILSSPLLDPAGADWFSGLGFNRYINSLATSQIDGYLGVPENMNMLVNGGFERFGITAGIPDHWERVTGTAVTHIDEVATPYIGSKALRFIGDGSTLHKIRQQIGASASTTNGTRARLEPNKHYAAEIFYRRASGALTTGVLRISVVDSGGTILYSTNAYASRTVSGGGSSATYANTSTTFTFFTPEVLSSSAYYFVIEMTTALTNTEILYLDEVKLIRMFEHPGYGHYAFTEKSAAATLREKYTQVNSISGVGENYQNFEQLFDMTSSGLYLPADSGGTETIADALSVNCP